MRLTIAVAWLAMLAVLGSPLPLRAQAPPPDLPRYDLDITLDTANHLVKVRQIVTWTNTSKNPAREIVFNAHAAYSIPDNDVGLLAKTVELLRMMPKEAMSFDGPPLQITEARYRGTSQSGIAKVAAKPTNVELTPAFRENNATALSISLLDEVAPGESATVELAFELKLPQKKGRWGQWDGITTLAQWLPVVAFHDDTGWQPTPFIPWHQPFFNEAGVYTARVKLPKEQKLAASASVKNETDVGDGWKQIEFEQICVRDFALAASARFEEWTGEADGVHVRCLAPPEHAFYAKVFVKAACDAIPVYNQWFGRYPYKQFTIVEGCFGWAGNECGGLVMIDDRIFNMPHIAKQYPTYLLQHELAHQWWYNTVGTNGFAETWMDEGLATYFSHRLADRTMGKNNELLDYPKGLRWLPNIRRDDFRNYAMIGAWARGDAHPPVQEMPKYEHLVNLTSAAYDRGGKVVGLIEQRLGEPAFLDFTRHIYRKYRFRILRVADYQRELEEYTGHSWDDFFTHWVRGAERCDWAVERVEMSSPERKRGELSQLRRLFPSLFPSLALRATNVTVYLKQQGEFNEPTTLGFRLKDGSDYQVRVPIHPDVPILQIDDLQATIACSTDYSGGKQRARAKVEITLPSEPVQISVDPDRLLIDAEPTNNNWRREFRFRMTPLYTQVDEVDVTNAHDRWNVLGGPWLYFSSYNDPWYTKSLMGGFRAGLFRTQEINAAAFLAYRANDRNIIAGADLLWDHALLPHVQVGLSLEKSIATVSNSDIPCSRGVLFARYVTLYGSSLYLPPFEYVEGFGVMQNRCLPDPRVPMPDTELFTDRTALGVHYHKNMMTPYWDAEGGYTIDATYQYGLPIFGTQSNFQQLYGQVAYVKGLSSLSGLWGDGPVRNWIADTRLAFRASGAAAFPTSGLFFALGGGDNFRGFDLTERQGSMLWLASAEWRVPICTNRSWDFLDHFGSVRNVYAAPFYDVGNAYVNAQQIGPIAHAAGVGLRVDVAWLGMIERTTLRFDIAKTLNSDRPWQFWFGIQHPF